MKTADLCLCCLLRPPDKHLNTPYSHLNRTEIYSDMLEYCFQLQLTPGSKERGICDECAEQLRHASDFKLQIECSLARLQARLRKDHELEDYDPLVKKEVDSEDVINIDVIRSVPVVKVEAVENDVSVGDIMCRQHAVHGGSATLPARETASELETASEVAEKPCKIQVTRPTKYKPNRAHIGDKSYTCDICKKTLTRKDYLVNHINRHTGNLCYPCTDCNRKFATGSQLKFHKTLHAGVRPFSCEQCNKKFSRKGDYNQHKLIHSGEKPFSCDECDKKYTRKDKLMEHKRIHTGEMPYTCEICIKRFFRKRSLIKHLKIHSREKLKCNMCKCKFSHKATLKKHIRSVHEKKSYA